MNRIEKRFKELAGRAQAAFIPYITAGDPDLDSTARLVLDLEKAGADIVELGIPFSDPLADGPVIQAASQRSLAKGTCLKKVFATVEILRIRTEIPIVFMTYYNPVLRYGPKRFIETCAQVGVDGVIIPDLPYDEAREIIALGRRSGVATIFLAAPTSTTDRLAMIAKNSTGFIYYVSLTGVTGLRTELPAEIVSNVAFLKKLTNKPVAVGFGISDAAQARRMAAVADGVIVGSAIVRIMAGGKRSLPKAVRLAAGLAKAIHEM